MEKTENAWTALAKPQTRKIKPSTHWDICICDWTRLGNTDAKTTKEDVPQVKAQLVLYVSDDVGSAVCFISDGFWAINSEGSLLVNVGSPDTDSNREGSNVHHDNQAELDCRIDISQVKCGCSCMTRGCCLEDSSKYPWTSRQVVNRRVVQIEYNNKYHIDGIHSEQDTKQYPCRSAWKE